MTMNLKLFKVTCQGMHHSHGMAYVVARDAEEAYQCVRQRLDAEGLGFAKEREMQTVELMAEDSDYPLCERRLYVPEQP